MYPETRRICSSDNPSDSCIYFNPDTNIKIVKEVLRREAKPGSNIYLCIDVADVRIAPESSKAQLNGNLHLLLTPSRETPTEGKGVTTKKLSIMKKYLDDEHEDLFFSEGDRKGCMTLKGSLLFYNFALLWKDSVIPGDVMELKTIESRMFEQVNKEVNELPFSEFCRLMVNYGQDSQHEIKDILRKMMFRILKLYNPGYTVNDMIFEAVSEEEKRGRGESQRAGFAGEVDTKFGLTILYTNKNDKNKYIHLPLDEDMLSFKFDDGKLLLSEILEYLKPLEELKHEFFMNHNTCRDDDKKRGDFGPGGYLKSLKKAPKERVHKNCFMNYFENNYKEDLRVYLYTHLTLIDYYEWLLENGGSKTR